MSPTKYIPVRSERLVPERDVGRPPILECVGLGLTIGGLHIVEDLDLMLSRTEIAGLIGPNGAGKTTVFNLLTKVYQPTSGAILVDGQNTSGMTPVQISRLGVARTFQNIRLFEKLSVADNVKVAMTNDTKYSLVSGLLHLPSWRRREIAAHHRALKLLSIFDMQGDADVRAGSLPYGAQRRLEIVRALATYPSLLLLDEPAAGMNPSETQDLIASIRRVHELFPIAIMLIEHDMNLVMNLCDGIWVLNFGRIIARGTPEDIQRNPAVIEAYLGKQKEADK